MDSNKSMKSVILVGNGASLLSDEYGKKIDEFDIVVRVNNFAINGFEKHVGTKRTVHFRCYNIRPKTFSLEHVVPAIDNHGISGLQDNRYDDFEEAVILKIREKSYIKACQEVGLYKKISYIDDSEYTRYLKMIGTSAPTTGVLCIAYAIKRWTDVTICGFDCLQGDAPSTEYCHYFSNMKFNQVERKKHNFIKEESFVKNLINIKKITCLMK